jgi:O-antigen/teichoic acid export membrane protein
MMRASLWSSAESLFRFGLQFAVSVVLARILSPRDFGIYALTFVFSSLSRVLIDGGFSSALIQKQDTDQETETAVFLYNVLAGAVLSLGIAAAGPFVARAYGFPVLEHLMFASAAIVFVTSLAAVPGALMHRRLEFVTISKIIITSSILGGGAGVIAAIAGAGVWTFVIQSAVSTLYSTIATWFVTDWRPRKPWRLAPARSLTRFSSFLVISSILETAYSNGYPLVLAKLYGVFDVAYFNRGQNLQANPSSVVGSTIQRLLFPALSQCSADRERMKAMARYATRAAAAINTPIMFFLATFPQLVIHVIYGSKWLPASAVLAVLAISGALFPMQVINLQVLLASGKSDIFFKLELYKKAVGISFVIVGCFFGLMGIAFAQAISLVIALVLNASPTVRLIDYSLVEQLRDCMPATALSGAVMGCLWFLAPFLDVSAPVKLLTVLALGGAAYLGAALVLRVGPFRDMLEKARVRRNGGIDATI